MVRYSMITGIVMFLVVTFCFQSPHNPAYAGSGDTGGVYSLGNSFSTKILSKEEVTGLSLRVGWNQLEPQKGVYDWSSLDFNVQKALEYGKKIMLRVSAGVYSPDWVYQMGAEKFEFTENGVPLAMPLPWDGVYVQQWVEFINTLGQRYSNIPEVVTVHMTGPCKVGEMHLPEKTNVERWVSAGYTDEKLIVAWKTVIDTYAQAFPQTSLAINIATPVSFGDNLGVVDEILNYAFSQLGMQLRVQGNWLSARTREDYPLYQMVKSYSFYTNVGFQMLCSINDKERFGGTLREAIDKGLNAGASYLEIYGVDIINPALAEDIQYADYYLKLNEK